MRSKSKVEAKVGMIIGILGRNINGSASRMGKKRYYGCATVGDDFEAYHCSLLTVRYFRWAAWFIKSASVEWRGEFFQAGSPLFHISSSTKIQDMVPVPLAEY